MIQQISLVQVSITVMFTPRVVINDTITQRSINNISKNSVPYAECRPSSEKGRFYLYKVSQNYDPYFGISPFTQ